MAKAKSWSVKGIDGSTRDIARDAAQAAGMTIGAWIDRAILKAKHGVLPEFAVTAVVPVAPVDSVPTPELDSASSDITTAIPTPVPTPSSAAPVIPEYTAEPEPGSPLPASFQPNGPDEPDEPVARATSAEPEAVPENVHPLVAEPQDRAGGEAFDEVAHGTGDDEWAGKPKPLAPPMPARPSALRYALVGIIFMLLLAGGGWLFVEFSSTEQTPPRPAIADTTAPAAARPEQTTRTANTPPVLPDEIRTGIEMAKAGDAKAQHDLGMLHLAGRFVKKDSAEAARWFERSAVQGLANAQFNLGVLYERGEGVAQNARLAFFWYQSAADQGLARAQHNLATAFAEGKGIATNYAKAVEWFTKSATAGLSSSQYSLAMIYERGLVSGTPDLAQARKWYEKATAQGDTQASERLAAIDARPDRGGPAQSATPTPAAANAAAQAKPVGRPEIREIQSLLASMNFDPGPADGQMGSRTADAIRLYQQFSGIEADGVPSQELLEDMRVVAGSMSKGG